MNLLNSRELLNKRKFKDFLLKGDFKNKLSNEFICMNLLMNSLTEFSDEFIE